MTDPVIPAPASAMVDAINSGDTEAFVDSFVVDGYVDDWGRILRGHDGIRSWSETDAIGMEAQMTVLSAETDGNTTSIHFEWASQRFTGESDGIFAISGSKLASFTIPPHR